MGAHTVVTFVGGACPGESRTPRTRLETTGSSPRGATLPTVTSVQTFEMVEIPLREGTATPADVHGLTWLSREPAPECAVDPSIGARGVLLRWEAVP